MNNTLQLSALPLLAAILSVSFAPATFAETDVVKQMAQVVMRINHYPSMQDKELLKDIAAKGSPAEVTMANALLNMEHRVRPADKAKLNEIANDGAQSQNTRDLAMIIHNINHKASGADKEKLSGM